MIFTLYSISATVYALLMVCLLAPLAWSLFSHDLGTGSRALLSLLLSPPFWLTYVPVLLLATRWRSIRARDEDFLPYTYRSASRLGYRAGITLVFLGDVAVVGALVFSGYLYLGPGFSEVPVGIVLGLGLLVVGLGILCIEISIRRWARSDAT